jgi:uncharacterized protein (TIRG00374 family)
MRPAVRLVVPIAVTALVISQLPRFRDATIELQAISATRLAIGCTLVMASIACYSGLTRTALVDAADRVPHSVMYRIQLSTRALANVVPGGNATASALGFRLLTRSGVSGSGTGFALATAGLCSAVVLNLVFWSALAVSLPVHGTDPAVVALAIVGLCVLVAAACVTYGAASGSSAVVRSAGWIATRLSIDPDTVAVALRDVRERMAVLRDDRALTGRLIGWSLAQWTLDMAALWVFLAAFEIRLDPIVLIVVFGAANIAAAVPVTPGGLGVVEGVYIASLVQLGFTFQAATFGIATYRLAHYVFPIIAGATAFLTLRAGPWKIASTDRPSAAEQHSCSDQRASSTDDVPVERRTRLEPRPNTELSPRCPHGT